MTRLTLLGHSGAPSAAREPCDCIACKHRSHGCGACGANRSAGACKRSALQSGGFIHRGASRETFVGSLGSLRRDPNRWMLRWCVARACHVRASAAPGLGPHLDRVCPMASRGRRDLRARADRGRASPLGGCPWMVAAWIGAAYWFIASTSFANPSITIPRSLTDTLRGYSAGGCAGVHCGATCRRRDRTSSGSDSVQTGD
jgi:hypothetical protein